MLAYLALAKRPLTRDHLAELFWGDRGDSRARHSLREALSGLRRALGEGTIARGGDVVSLGERAGLRVDALEVRRASAEGNASTVLALYVGPFLDGLHVHGASAAFESWLIDERLEIARLFVDACAAECLRLRAIGDWTVRAAVARRWLASDPLDPRAATALLESLAAPGTRVAIQQALQAFDVLVGRLASDFQLEPDPAVMAIAQDLSRELAAHPGEQPPPNAKSLDATRPQQTLDTDAARIEQIAPGPDPAAIPKRRWQLPMPPRGQAVAVAIALLMISAAIWAALGPARGTHELASHADPRPYVAVLATSGRLADDDCWLMEAMPRLLAASLGRAASLETITLPLPSPGAVRNEGTCDGASGGDFKRSAAEETGASVTIQPTLSRIGREYSLALDVRDARNGRSLREEVVTDTTPFALAERAAVVLTSALAISNGSPEALVGVETRSVEAYTAYLDALRLGAEGHGLESMAAFDRAIAADSTFVTALMERLRRSPAPSTPTGADTVRRLMAALERHLDRATPYDRLDFDVLRAALAGEHSQAERLARDLARRFPHDPRATARLSELLSNHGRFEEAAAETERAIELDSLAAASRGQRAECELCVTRMSLGGLLLFTGRGDEAERVARLTVAEHAERPALWAGLSELLAVRGEFREALAAAERARAAAPEDLNFALEPVRRLVEAGRLDEAGRRLRPALADPNPELAKEAAELEAARLRELGRHSEAVRLLARWPRTSRIPGSVDMIRAASFAALGDSRDAVAALAAPAPAMRPHRDLTEAWLWRQEARAFAWSRALLADAIVVSAEARGAAVDTLRLRALADSIQVIGAESYYGRDWRLHHHVRGLIAARDHRWADAVAEFEQARWTRTGWTRTLIELSRAHLALGQPERALATLADARATVLNSMGRYTTRTEIAYWTSLAHYAAGRPDSALVYASRVRRAWRDADPIVRRRLASLPIESLGADRTAAPSASSR